MRVLLIEDDDDLSKRIAASLRTENFVVDVARNGEDAEHAGLTEIFDAAVLDLGLPKIDGVAVLKSWRSAGRSLPVLVLTARDGWPDKVARAEGSPTATVLALACAVPDRWPVDVTA